MSRIACRYFYIFMLGFTHLQTAQPVMFGHYMIA
ncbi:MULTISPECIES: lyase family protein [Bartonella]|nr:MULTISPECIES: lyase family protein [Bartonella]